MVVSLLIIRNNRITRFSLSKIEERVYNVSVISNIPYKDGGVAIHQIIITPAIYSCITHCSNHNLALFCQQHKLLGAVQGVAAVVCKLVFRFGGLLVPPFDCSAISLLCFCQTGEGFCTRE